MAAERTRGVDLEAPVGIVGAGPVGMACALRLASFGVACEILEADPHLIKQGSKACLIQGDVLEILDKVGCAEQIAAEGVPWHVGHTYVRGQEIVRTVYPRPIGFGPFVNISQYRIQQIMLEALRREPRCRIRWSHRVEAVSEHDEEVVVTAVTPDGPTEHRFRYLVACDGVRSLLRDLVGVEWTGYTHNARFLISDIRVKLPLPKERHFHYDPPFNPGKQLVIHPQPDDMWRIDWQLPPGTDIEAERRTGLLEQRIRGVIGDLPYEIDWLSTYRFYQRVVEHFRVGRVFFAGDAAHALPPYGARGMNSGLQDADNLAWKLALVLQGRAGEALLDSYHQERYAAARENLRVTEATIQFMVPPNPLRRWFRDLLLWLSTPFKRMRRHVNSGRMAEPYVYADSPIVARDDDDSLIGSFAPDAFVSSDGETIRIRRLLGHEFVCLYVGDDAGQALDFVGRSATADLAANVRFVLALPASARAPEALGGVPVIRDEQDALATRYGAAEPRWILIRPDGHVAAAFAAGRPVDLAALMAHCVGGPAPAAAGAAGTAGTVPPAALRAG